MKRPLERACLSITLPRELATLLRQAASDDNRSVSSLLTAISRNYLEREGYTAAGSDTRQRIRQTRLEL